MKITYVTEAWPPVLNEAALAAARTVSHLRSRGHGVELVRPKQHASDAGDTNTVTVPAIGVPLLPHLKLGFPMRQRFLKRWGAARPDVVHIATPGPLGWSACSAACALDIPVTSDFPARFDEHDTRGGVNAVLPLLRAYLRGFHNRTTCTFVPTEEAAGVLTGLGFRNVVVNERGVDTLTYSRFHRSESLRRHLKAVGPVVLYVGDLCADRNVATLIEVFDALRLAEPHAQFVFAGDGPMRSELQERCPGAIFAGRLDGSMGAAYYASADMLLVPSLSEISGPETLEAMVSGLPVVAYDMGAAAAHIRNEENGITVAPGDHFAFVRAAVALACDEPLRERLGAAACQSVRTTSWARRLASFELALHASCERKSPHSAGMCLA